MTEPQPQPLGTERIRAPQTSEPRTETELRSLIEGEVECHVASIIADYWPTPLPNRVVERISERAARLVMSDLRLKTDQVQQGDPNA